MQKYILHLEIDRNSQKAQDKWKTAKTPISRRVIRWHMFNGRKSRREWIFEESGELDYRRLAERISATWRREKGMLQITIPSREVEGNFVILVQERKREKECVSYVDNVMTSSDLKSNSRRILKFRACTLLRRCTSSESKYIFRILLAKCLLQIYQIPVVLCILSMQRCDVAKQELTFHSTRKVVRYETFN